jgi:hypothetical protein
MASAKGLSPCCFHSFAWNGVPTGHEGHLASNLTYITGSNPRAAVLFVHDALGWKFGNARLLADHFAEEVRFPSHSQFEIASLLLIIPEDP